jgi:hypothetical protein
MKNLSMCQKNELARARRGLKRKNAILNDIDGQSALGQLVAAVDPKFFDPKVDEGLKFGDMAWAFPPTSARN